MPKTFLTAGESAYLRCVQHAADAFYFLSKFLDTEEAIEHYLQEWHWDNS